MANTIIKDNKLFINSNYIKVYPSAYRAAQNATTDGSTVAEGSVNIFDIESNLNTEYNLTHNGGFAGIPAYVVSQTEFKKLTVVIEGYRFEINLEAVNNNILSTVDFVNTLFGTITDTKYRTLNIVLKQSALISNTNTWILKNNFDATSSILDSAGSDESYYFGGCYFTENNNVTENYRVVTENEITFSFDIFRGTELIQNNTIPNIQKFGNTTSSKNKENIKLFLLGTESQADRLDTYSNNKVYIQNNKVFSNNNEVLTAEGASSNQVIIYNGNSATWTDLDDILVGKATCDGAGDNIVNTYATKAGLTEALDRIASTGSSAAAVATALESHKTDANAHLELDNRYAEIDHDHDGDTIYATIGGSGDNAALRNPGYFTDVTATSLSTGSGTISALKADSIAATTSIKINGTEVALSSHNHDTVYSKLDHTHDYVTEGTLDSAIDSAISELTNDISTEYLAQSSFNTEMDTIYDNLSGIASEIGNLEDTIEALDDNTVKLSPTSTQTGDISVSGTVSASTFYVTSDIRKKENITTYQPIASILDLPVKKFNFIGDDVLNIGCIAQDLQELFPELVYENTDGYLSISESKLIYPLLLEVKKLKQRVDELENR